MSYRYVHRVLNFTLVLAGALFVTSLVQRYVVTKRPAARTISLPGVDFSRSNKTLLLFLQMDCDICIESLPFYRRLAQTVSHSADVNLVLITPTQPEVAREFFMNKGLSFDTVLQGKSGLIGVHLSPTLILADSTGTVHGSWIGKLSAQQETEVRTMLKN